MDNGHQILSLGCCLIIVMLKRFDP